MLRPRNMPPLLILLFLLGIAGQDGGPYCVKIEEDVCTSIPRESCEDVERQDCRTVDEEMCFPATEESCRKVPDEDACTTIDREVCQDVEKEICAPIVEKQCEEIKKWICPLHHGDFVCSCVLHHRRHLNFCTEDCERQWNEQYCWTKIIQQCRDVNTTACETKTEEICTNIPEEQCTPQIETLCESIPTEECKIERVEVCQNVTENVCMTVEDQVCEKQLMDRFCTNDEEGLLRSSIFNGDVLGASAVLSSSENVFSLGEGLMYLPEQTFLVVQSENRGRDPDVVAFQALATSALNNTDTTKLVNAIILSLIPDCRCRDRTAAEYDAIARGLKEDFADRAYLEQLVDSDLSEFGGNRRRRSVLATSASPVDSFVCAYCLPERSCSKMWWC